MTHSLPWFFATKKANPCVGKSLRVKQLNTDRSTKMTCRIDMARFLFFFSPGRSAKSKRRPKLLMLRRCVWPGHPGCNPG